MGMYTNYERSFSSSNYTDVEPFVGENFNYHELGIMAAAEIEMNHNNFMKSIALSELAAVEQTGSTDVIYEAVDFKGIFEKIKMFFKKIIEKIHKILHTFIAKMSAWFGNNASFAKNYEKEVIKGWANIRNDWEFKGYKFSHINLNTEKADTFSIDCKDAKETLVNEMIKDGDLAKLNTENNIEATDDGLKKIRERMDNIKDAIRKDIIDSIKNDSLTTAIIVDTDGNTGYDSSEFSEELFKIFRSDADSKESYSKDEIVKGYGGSVTGMMTYIKEFDKIKSKIESAERKITKGIDDLIKKVEKAQNDLIKENKNEQNETQKKINENIVQGSAVFQSIYSALSEYMTQTFSALLQAQKEACTQAKEIAVKVIGQSKKMTEESYDYSSSGTGFNFISSVKLV